MLRSATGAALAVAAVAAETIAKPVPASAGTDGDVILGGDNIASGSTVVVNSTPDEFAFEGSANGSGAGILGISNTGAGVFGESHTGFGVQGVNDVMASTQFSTATGVVGSSTSGIGVQGCSDTFWGVYAISKSNTGLQAGSTSADAVVATSVSGSGVYAQSGGTDGYAVTRDAVRGFTDAAAAAGVRGENVGGGHGVSGITASTGSSAPAAVDGTNSGSGPGVRGQGGIGVLGKGGIGVLAQTTGPGTALQVAGPAVFSRSGEVTIKFPATSATIAVPGGLSAHALVLALLQSAMPGVFVVSAVPTSATGKVTISLNKAPGSRARPLTAKVAWFVVN